MEWLGSHGVDISGAVPGRDKLPFCIGSGLGVGDTIDFFRFPYDKFFSYVLSDQGNV